MTPTKKQLAARRKFVAMVRARAKAKKRDQIGSVPKKTARKKVAAKKPSGSHKDTKSHNVNIRVVSGLDKVTHKGRKTAVHYTRMAGTSKTMYDVRDMLEKDIISHTNAINTMKGAIADPSVSRWLKSAYRKDVAHNKKIVTMLKKQLRDQNKLINQALK